MNGLAEIIIKGEKVGLKYGPAISFPKILPQFNSDKAYDPKIFNEVISVEIIYWGYQHYCALKREIPKYSYEQIFDWVLDKENLQQANVAIKTFNDEVRAYTGVIKEERDEKKNLLIGKKSKKQRTANLD